MITDGYACHHHRTLVSKFMVKRLGEPLTSDEGEGEAVVKYARNLWQGNNSVNHTMELSDLHPSVGEKSK